MEPWQPTVDNLMIEIPKLFTVQEVYTFHQLETACNCSRVVLAFCVGHLVALGILQMEGELFYTAKYNLK